MQLETFFERSAARHPDKTMLACGEERWSYAALESAANRLAHALLARGVRRGDRVAIHLDNCPQAVVAILATLKIGAAFMVLNPSTKPDKLAFVLGDSRASTLFAPARKLLALDSYWETLPHLRTIVATECDAPSLSTPEKGVDSFAAMTAAQWPESRPPKQAIDVDLAALVYTSGSTGQPKGVMLTHRNMVSASTSITTYLENRADDVVLSVLPLSFDYGLYQVLMAWQYGGTVVLEKSFAYPHAVLQKLIAERVTGFPLVPTMLAMLLQLDLTQYDFGCLRYVTNTGAALPIDHIARLRKLLPHVRVYSMYGLTECKRVSYLPPEEIDRRPGSVGRGMPNEEVYLVDESGNRLGPGETGELVVRGSNVMPGYWERPEETARMLRPGPIPGERVLYTGDLFRMDEDGFLYFIGRRDDIIKSRGEKVSPKEVENVLHAHPDVVEAAVVGVPDAILGQAIRAYVVCRGGAPVAPRDLQRHCAAHLEDFMVPQVIELREALPKTSSGKINKRELAEAVEA